MVETIMDACVGCKESFVSGEEGSGRLAIKRYDSQLNQYFYEHYDLCSDCVNKLYGGHDE